MPAASKRGDSGSKLEGGVPREGRPGIGNQPQQGEESTCLWGSWAWGLKAPTRQGENGHKAGSELERAEEGIHGGLRGRGKWSHIKAVIK